MGRLLLVLALLGIAVLLLRRSLGAGRPSPARKLEREGSQTLVCSECGTRYDPEVSGRACPRCGQ